LDGGLLPKKEVENKKVGAGGEEARVTCLLQKQQRLLMVFSFNPLYYPIAHL